MNHEITMESDQVDPFDTAVEITVGDTKAFTLPKEVTTKISDKSFQKTLN